VTNKSSSLLRLHVEQPTISESPAPVSQIGQLLAAFEQATGWQLRYEQSPAGLGEVWSTTIESYGNEPAGRLVLAGGADKRTQQAALSIARPLALAIGGLLSENNRLRRAVWQREAELAAGVPISVRPNEELHLAERLEAVLKSGAESMGCQAAGLYLLDEGTTELKLRAAWGLAPERLLAPARPLRGAVADLEALVGHAVVLEDTTLLPHWRCPEDFAAAVCVPVSSPSIPLGTLWAFCDEKREFSPQETNLLEIIAGRIAADLDREMLLATSTEAKSRDKQFDGAAQWLADRLPSVAPLLDDYQLAGWTAQAAGIGGDFHDWSVLPDGRLALAVGDAEGSPLEAALGAASLHAALKSHAGYRHGAGEIMQRINESLIAGSPGDQRAALGYALIEPDNGQVELALAGDAALIVVGIENRQLICAEQPALGESPEASFFQKDFTLGREEALVLISGGVRRAIDSAGLRIGEASIASLVQRHLRESASELVARLRRLLECGELPADDMTVVVLKRRASR
jgi:phosphoserine phosphatase RsbU/P